MTVPFSEHVVGPLIFGIVIFILFCCFLRGCLMAIVGFVQAKSKAPRKSGQSNQVLEKEKSVAQIHIENERQLHDAQVATVVTVKTDGDEKYPLPIYTHDESLKMIIIQ